MTSLLSTAMRPLLFLATIIFPIVGQLPPWLETLPEHLQILVTASRIRFDNHSTTIASTDFGHLYPNSPNAIGVLYPSTSLDIAHLINFSFSSPNPFTISARGHGHSIHGQAQAPGGVVIEMAALCCHGTDGIYARINVSSMMRFADVGGEQLWVDVLHETLKHGLAPRSWTDYLYLSVGGTLSNAGVSGQAFRHGPQISNVYELDVITGKGEKMTSSDHLNPDLFYAVLGGLGQFGIITRARIPLEPAPQRVRWVRLIYTDFEAFTRDQEMLISLETGFDYVEGSLLADHSIISAWRSSFFSASDLVRISYLSEKNGGVYCLEATMNYVSAKESMLDEELGLLLEELSFVPQFKFTKDVSYLHFLNRVRDGELKLRSAGLWDIPHPWLNIFVPKSRILDFDRGVFKGILKNKSPTGSILIYPMNKRKWDERMSAMFPDEPVFYSIGLLQSDVLVQDLEYLEDQNTEILRFCEESGIKFKKYLPHYQSQEDWSKHFGPKWDHFIAMKHKFDPKAILSPGQRIFMPTLLQTM